MHRFLALLFTFVIAQFCGAGSQAYAQDLSGGAKESHIALILPLSTSAFSQYAQQVKLGFLAAAKIDAGAGLPVKVYVTSDQASDVIASYSQAVETGARIIVGPIGKDAATAIAKSGLVSVTTLALSHPDSDIPLPPRFYVFGLQIDSEARFVAQRALRDSKRRRALIVSGPSSLERRLGQSFLEEWTKSGGEAVSQFDFKDDPTALAKIKLVISSDEIDTVFLALDTAQARLVRPYLGSSVAMYATSQIFPGNSQALLNFDLDRIRFMDMPWLLQPDHPAVMSYSEEEEVKHTPELERFFALGIDAYRLAQELISQSAEENIFLDGVTGEITLRSGNQFVRKPLLAVFYDGRIVVLRDLSHHDRD